MGALVEGEFSIALDPHRVVGRNVALGREALKLDGVCTGLSGERQHPRCRLDVALMIHSDLSDQGDLTIQVAAEKVQNIPWVEGRAASAFQCCRAAGEYRPNVTGEHDNRHSRCQRIAARQGKFGNWHYWRCAGTTLQAPARSPCLRTAGRGGSDGFRTSHIDEWVSPCGTDRSPYGVFALSGKNAGRHRRPSDAQPAG